MQFIMNIINQDPPSIQKQAPERSGSVMVDGNDISCAYLSLYGNC